MDEMIISIKDLAAILIRKGKSIVLLGVVFALLLGGFQGGLVWKASLAPEASLDQLEYEQELMKLEHTIEGAMQNLSDKEEYLDNSIWMQIDPHNKHTAEVYFSITGVDEIAADMIFGDAITPMDYLLNQIKTQYEVSWSRLNLSEDLGLTAYEGVQEKYIRELVQISFTEANAGCVRAIGRNAVEAKELAEAASEALLNCRKVAAANSYEHDVTRLDVAQRVEIDAEMAARQEAHRTAVLEYNDLILDTKAAMRKLDQPDSVLVAVIKGVIIGGVMGVALACVWFCGKALVDDALLSSAQAEKMLGIPFIGSIASKKGLEYLASIVSGERIWKDEQQALAYIAETVAMHEVNGTILVVSSSGEKLCDDQIQKLQKTLGSEEQVLFENDFMHNPKALSAVRNCSAVLLAESSGRTKLREAAEVVQFAGKCGKPVIGFVMV